MLGIEDFNRRAIDQHGTAIGAMHAGNDLHQRALAGAVLAANPRSPGASDNETFLRTSLIPLLGYAFNSGEDGHRCLVEHPAANCRHYPW